MKKLLLSLFVFVIVFTTAACSSNKDSAKAKGDNKIVKVGISSGDTRTWDYIVKIAKKQGVNIELVKFSDYIQPNIALNEGEIDANSFQTVAYFDQMVQDQKLELETIGATVLAPMGIYSKKIKSLEELPKGATVAVPNDATNFGRALLLLQEAKLITLNDKFDGLGNLNNIATNPKKLKIEPVASPNTPRLLDDADASIINNNFALEAGLNLKDAIFQESATAKPYINIIAVKKGDTDRSELKKLVELYQSKEVEEFIKETYKGNIIPAYVSVEEVNNYKDTWKK